MNKRKEAKSRQDSIEDFAGESIREMKNLGKAVGYFAVYFVGQFLMQFAFMMVAAISQGVNSEKGMIKFLREK